MNAKTTVDIRLVKDNLDELKNLEDNSINHFINDPPFNKNKNYVGSPNDKGSVQTLVDTWRGGTEGYLWFIEERLDHMIRALKFGGNIMFHCDSTVLFELHNLCVVRKGLFLRCHLGWVYSGGGIPKKNPPNKVDHILVFSNSNNKDDWAYHKVVRQYSEKTQKNPRHSATSGGKLIDLEKGTPIGTIWSAAEENLLRQQAIDKKYGFPLRPDFGPIDPVQSGTPGKAVTEKPLALYQRIVYMFTDPGDSVCDAFMGGGTTIMAARSLGRHAIGFECDLTAYRRTVSRLQDAGYKYIEKSNKSYVNTNPDLLSHHDWADRVLIRFGCEPNPKKSGDHGVDGYDMKRRYVAQCKRGRFVASYVRNLYASARVFAKEHGIDNVTCVCIADSKDGKDAFTGGAHKERAKIRAIKDSIIKDIIFITAQEIDNMFEKAQPINLNLIYKNDNIIAEAMGLHKRAVKYAWYVECKKNQSELFGLTPKPIIIQTTKPELNLSDMNIKDFNYLKCEMITSDGGVIIREMRLN